MLKANLVVTVLGEGVGGVLFALVKTFLEIPCCVLVLGDDCFSSFSFTVSLPKIVMLLLLLLLVLSLEVGLALVVEEILVEMLLLLILMLLRFRLELLRTEFKILVCMSLLGNGNFFTVTGVQFAELEALLGESSSVGFFGGGGDVSFGGSCGGDDDEDDDKGEDGGGGGGAFPLPEESKIIL